jgi:uncharacterized membrane protein
MLTNAIYMEHARNQLKGNWKSAVLITLVYMAISLLASSIPRIGGIVNLAISGPILVGYYTFFLALRRGEILKIEVLFNYFNQFGRIFIAYLLMIIYIILWSLLLIVPGIIAALGYSQLFFILSEDSTINSTAALRKSKEMMRGHKMQLFYLCCRFIGWGILGLLTAGIGFLWILPYVMTSMANFHEDLKATGGQNTGSTAAASVQG